MNPQAIPSPRAAETKITSPCKAVKQNQWTFVFFISFTFPVPQRHLMISFWIHFRPISVGFPAYNKTFRTTESCSVALKDLRGEIISLLLPAISSLTCKSLLFQYSRNYDISRYWQQPRHEHVYIQVNMNWQAHTHKQRRRPSFVRRFAVSRNKKNCSMSSQLWLKICKSVLAPQIGRLSASPVSTSVNCSVSFVVPFRTSPSLGDRGFPIQSLTSFLFKIIASIVQQLNSKPRLFVDQVKWMLTWIQTDLQCVILHFFSMLLVKLKNGISSTIPFSHF